MITRRYYYLSTEVMTGYPRPSGQSNAGGYASPGIDRFGWKGVARYADRNEQVAPMADMQACTGE